MEIRAPYCFTVPSILPLVTFPRLLTNFAADDEPAFEQAISEFPDLPIYIGPPSTDTGHNERGLWVREPSGDMGEFWRRYHEIARAMGLGSTMRVEKWFRGEISTEAMIYGEGA